MKIKKTYDTGEYITVKDARYESFDDIDVIIGIVVEDVTECQLFDVGSEVCLLNTPIAIEVIEE